MNVKPHRKHIERIIDINSTKVKIYRPVVVDLGYGSKEERVEYIGEEDVYICFKNDRVFRTFLHDHGHTTRETPDIRFIAKYDSNIKTGDILNYEYQVVFSHDCMEIAKQGGLDYYEE